MKAYWLAASMASGQRGNSWWHTSLHQHEKWNPARPQSARSSSLADQKLAEGMQSLYELE